MLSASASCKNPIGSVLLHKVIKTNSQANMDKKECDKFAKTMQEKLKDDKTAILYAKTSDSQCESVRGGIFYIGNTSSSDPKKFEQAKKGNREKVYQLCISYSGERH